ncbi:unnamed protein product [Arctogadus glacialis]
MSSLCRTCRAAVPFPQSTVTHLSSDHNHATLSSLYAKLQEGVTMPGSLQVSLVLREVPRLWLSNQPIRDTSQLHHSTCSTSKVLPVWCFLGLVMKGWQYKQLRSSRRSTPDRAFWNLPWATAEIVELCDGVAPLTVGSLKSFKSTLLFTLYKQQQI